MDDKGQNTKPHQLSKEQHFDSFVLEKNIFSNVFDKDIKRIYIYKKAERLARALHLVSPAFSRSDALKKRADEIAVALIDGAVLPPAAARAALSRELLSLSSLLSIVRTTGSLSPMNADLIGREAHLLLEEVASYEEPRLSLEHTPTLAELAKDVPKKNPVRRSAVPRALFPPRKETPIGHDKGHISDIPSRTVRRDAILGILKTKGPSYIKDVSMLMRGMSEKTVQRELQALAAEGVVKKEGERRWTRYSVPS